MDGSSAEPRPVHRGRRGRNHSSPSQPEGHLELELPSRVCEFPVDFPAGRRSLQSRSAVRLCPAREYRNQWSYCELVIDRPRPLDILGSVPLSREDPALFRVGAAVSLGTAIPLP